MRLAYLGTPAVAAGPLRALVAGGHDVALAVSGADKRRGRGRAVSPSPVKATALELAIPATDRVDDILELAPPAELGVVVAFGRLIRPHVLAALPMVNMHFSLLPRWRGAAPVERAILAGDDRTGVCLMEVVDELDAGGVYRRAELPIGPDATAAELRTELERIGTDLLLDLLRAPLPAPEPQQGEVTYAHKLTPEDLHLDWSRPAIELHRRVRVGGAWTTHHGRRLKVWRSSLDPDSGGVAVPAGDRPLALLEVQPEGKTPMAATDWARGARFEPGQALGD